jgi:hypothetical protein
MPVDELEGARVTPVGFESVETGVVGEVLHTLQHARCQWASNTTTLAASATFTGTSRDLFNVAVGTDSGVNAYVNEYRALAVSNVTGVLNLEISVDNSTWRRVMAEPTANTDTGGLFVAEIKFFPAARYARVVYVNGGTIQTQFNLVEAMFA